MSLKPKRKAFSLVELLIVVAIMGALAALIMPQFMNAETQAKDSACDYNNAGITRYIQMFHTTNSVYPTGFHTGMNDGTGDESVKNNDNKDAMAPITKLNMQQATRKLEDVGYYKSLVAAGIDTLSSGTGYATSIMGDDGTTVNVHVRAVSGDWYEALAGSSTTARDTASAPVKLQGSTLEEIVAIGDAGTQDRRLNREGKKFKLVPLFVSGTVDWEYAYVNGQAKESMVGISSAAKCPWLPTGDFRFYIAFFKVYEDGTKARFVGSACPECGVLDADIF